MLKVKRFFTFALALIMVMATLAGCKDKDSSSGSSSSSSSSSSSKSEAVIQEAGQGETAGKDDDRAAAAGQIESLAYALPSQSFDLKPFSGSANGRSQILNLIWPRLIYLTKYGATLEDAEMWLAKKVTEVDNKTYDVELYDYIYDNQGFHITAEDVKWSYEMSVQNVEIGNLLESIEILSDYNLRFTLKSPGVGKIETVLGFHRMAICSKEWYEGATEEERSVNCATAAAYYVKEFTTGSRVVLEAVDNYWQKDEALKGVSGQQNVKTIYCPIIVEPAVRGIALENGEIDFTSISVSALGQFFENGAAKEGYNVVPIGGQSAYVLFMNMDENSNSPVAKNLKLRQAILTAIDPDSMRLAGGYDDYSSWLCYDFGSPLMPGYQKSWEEGYFNYDPDKAKELLAEAGYPDGITLRFMYGVLWDPGMIAVITENLEAVGIHVEALAYDQALYNTYKYDSSVWDINIDSKGGYSLPDHWNNLFSPGGYENGGANFCKDQELYDLVDKVMLTGAQDDMNDFHDRCVELALGKGLFAPAAFYAAQDGVIDIVMNHYMYPMINAWTFAEDFKSEYVSK